MSRESEEAGGEGKVWERVRLMQRERCGRRSEWREGGEMGGVGEGMQTSE